MHVYISQLVTRTMLSIGAMFIIPTSVGTTPAFLGLVLLIFRLHSLPFLQSVCPALFVVKYDRKSDLISTAQ